MVLNLYKWLVGGSTAPDTKQKPINISKKNQMIKSKIDHRDFTISYFWSCCTWVFHVFPPTQRNI